MSRRLVSRGFNSASLLLIGTFCLVGCRGLPWSSPNEPPRVSARIDPSLVLGELQIDDGSRVEPAGLQLSPPSAESDWLAGTQVVAIVNGEPLFASEVLQRQSQSLAAAREQISGPRYRVLQEDLLRKQLKGFVDRRLMAQAMMSGLEADRVEFLDKQLDTIFTKQELPQLLAGRNLQSIVELKRKLTAPSRCQIGDLLCEHQGGGGLTVVSSSGSRNIKKPEFEVTVEAPDKPIRLGEVIEAKVLARYYHGAPVDRGKGEGEGAAFQSQSVLVSAGALGLALRKGLLVVRAGLSLVSGLG